MGAGVSYKAQGLSKMTVPEFFYLDIKYEKNFLK